MGKVGWRLEPSYCPLEAFLREPKLNSQSTEALRKMLRGSSGKMDVSRAHLWSVGFPYLLTWLPRFCGKAEPHPGPAAAEIKHVHMVTKQAALDCMHLLDSRIS